MTSFSLFKQNFCLKRVFFFIFFLPFFSCSGENSIRKEWFFRSGTSLHFDGLCSEPDYRVPSAVQSYAVFENIGSESKKALVLMEIYLGSTFLDKKKSIGFNLEKARIQPVWPGESFAFQLELKEKRAGRKIVSNVQGYYEATQGISPNFQRTKFKFPKKESFQWSIYSTNEFSESLPITIPLTDIQNLDSSYEMSLILKNLKSREKVILKGPDLLNVKTKYNIPDPNPKKLGVVEILNPKTKGGLFDWFRVGARYSDCDKALVEERKVFEQMTF